MKKKLPDSDITNELSASSVFFTARETSEPTTPPLAPVETVTSPTQKPDLLSSTKPQPVDAKPPSNHDTVTPRNRNTKVSSNQRRMGTQAQPSMTPPTNSYVSPEMLEEVRRVVKQLGKEAATHRFSVEEKRALADLVYTYNRQGYRTSENEITRIAVNWLLLDFKESGEQSVLARMLERLHG
jgi:hypothetical protein